MNSDPTPVWLITGCSTGFGNELARAVLARGFRAVVTARQRDHVAALASNGDNRALPLALDVTSSDQIAHAVRTARETFGRIDVLVNNAGYGYLSAVEEGEDDQIRAQFEANVFGLFALTRAVLPLMREQGSGRIINITSVAGLQGFAGSGYYAASKHAVEGWSDSLAVETAPLGIKVTCVEPGPFRTDWAGRSMIQTPNRIEAYADTAGARMKGTSSNSGKQAGDPARAAQAMIRIAETPEPPRHFVLGRFGNDSVASRLKERLAEIERWREAGLATDFPS